MIIKDKLNPEVIKKKYLKEFWKEPISHFKGRTGFFLKQLKAFYIAAKGFIDNKASFRASALTLWTMLSIVPMMAMLFGIAKGFGYDEVLKNEIKDSFEGHTEVIDYLINIAENLLSNIKEGLIVGVGIAFLFWSVMKVLTNIEISFNDIWRIKKQRTFVRKFTDYLALIVVAPILILISGAANIYIQNFAKNLVTFDYLAPITQFFIGASPVVIIWMVFTLLYVIMPNTRVKLQYALIAGMISGTAFYILQWAYINFQMGVSRYETIYGVFAALPLFIIWLQWSYLIILFGAEISFAYQNIENYEFESESLIISHSFKRILTLMVVYKIVKKFDEAEPPLSSSDLARELNLPIRIIQEIINDLTSCKIISEIATEDPKQLKYQPAMNINRITTEFVTSEIESLGKDQFESINSEEMERFRIINSQFIEAIKNSDANQLFHKM